jgi:hypothetical protein
VLSIILSVRTVIFRRRARRGKRRVVIPRQRSRNAAMRLKMIVPFGLWPKTPAVALRVLPREWPLAAPRALHPTFLAATHPIK